VVEAFTTSRIARRDAAAMAGSPPARSDRLLVLADTRTAAFPAMPFGDLRAAGVAEILAAAAGSWSDWRTRKGHRAQGLSTLLNALSGHRGDMWQQRWEAAGLNEVFTPVARLAGNADEARLLRIATAALFALRVVRPSMGALRGNRLFQYADCFHAAQHDAGLDAFWTQVTATVDKPVTRQEIFADVALALTSQQIGWSDLTPGRLLAYAADSREYWRTYASEHTQTRLTGHQLWAHLCAHKHFPAGTPPTLREAIRVPRLTAAQLVDLYPIARREVAAVIAEYLQIRGTVMDYTSVQILAQRLASLFWGKIEQLAPDQADFALSPQLYDKWRETVRWQDSGKPREQQDAVLLAVRAFYYDINAWATQDPAR
jgi:hypothetical protein